MVQPAPAAVWWLLRVEYETGYVPARAFTGGSVFGRQPAHVTQVTHFRASSQQHEHPFIYGVHHNHALTLCLLRHSLARPSRWPFAFAFVHDRAKRRVNIAA